MSDDVEPKSSVVCPTCKQDYDLARGEWRACLGPHKQEHAEVYLGISKTGKLVIVHGLSSFPRFAADMGLNQAA
jgi:hypothetical protein